MTKLKNKTGRLIRKIVKRFFLKVSNGVTIKKIDELAITPTMKCCLNCVMCHQKEIKNWPNMQYENFKNLLINLKKGGVSKISLVGGEIFVHPDMWKFIELMEKMKFQYDLSSNLFFVPGGVEKFNKLMGLEMITTSIDGLGKLHDEIRGVPGAFEKTIENIKKVIKAKIPIDVACVIQKANLNELERTVGYLCKIGVKSITLLVENTIPLEEKELNKRIIKSISGKESEILVSSCKNQLGVMKESDWPEASDRIKNAKKISLKYKCSLNLATQLIYPELLKKNVSLKNYTCGTFAGYNMIVYNKCELPFCGFIKLVGDFDISKKNPLETTNSKEYVALKRAFKKNGALPMCRMCCALKRK